MAHDLMNLASLVRVVGGKPLDEAMVNDAMFRINSYRAGDAARMSNLGEAIKLTALGGDVPDSGQLDTFMHNYVRNGGKQSNFVSFMTRQYKNIDASQANQLRNNLSSPYAVGLQRLMGGMDLQDVRNSGGNSQVAPAGELPTAVNQSTE